MAGRGGPGRPFKKGGDERIGPGKPFAKGNSGNHEGRPRNAVSITYWLKQFGAMTTDQVAEACKLYAAEFKKNDAGELPLAAVLALRMWMALINEPSPGLFSELLDRIDGKVTQKMETEQRGTLTVRVKYVDGKNS
jgi:hypothetical protein